ncbi:MAG: ATP-binding cassette domain-containing protein [Clostridiales Family XIII bacterium]|jgi:oligopeptide transport system ATP-binding protein|nr:ATP-binding cassette domain-containing protein [Clostridiales Family XIII bacterium]
MHSKSVPLLSVGGLKKYFPVRKGGVIKAVDGVSFDIARGETFSLVGESGCGKTTCGRTILGIHRKTAGSVKYDGAETETFSKQQEKRFHKNAQMIFQDPYACLDPRMTIGAIVKEGMHEYFKISESEKQERALELLARVGLPHGFVSRYPHELSGGQRQRVGVARALALEPELIVCDEPLSALDVSIQAQLINLLISLQQELNLTYLFISHDLAVVRHISDQTGVMYMGALVELGDSDVLFRKPAHPYTQLLFSSIPTADAKSVRKSVRANFEDEMPSAVNPPSGCRFRTRCGNAETICSREAPALRKLGDRHCAACHFV